LWGILGATLQNSFFQTIAQDHDFLAEMFVLKQFKELAKSIPSVGEEADHFARDLKEILMHPVKKT